jgi:hypothetical protein
LPGPHTRQPELRVTLEILRGRVRQRLRQVRGRVFLIGSASDCDLVLGDLRFPEAYAYLFVTGSQVTVRRLASGPPLLVAGEAVETAELFHGDLVAFGPFEWRIQIEPRPGGGRPADDQRQPTEDAVLTGDDAADEVRNLLLEIRRTLAGQTAPPPALVAERACAWWPESA